MQVLTILDALKRVVPIGEELRNDVMCTVDA